MISIEEIKSLIEDNKYQWSIHCTKRMEERNISRELVINGLINGKIIEQYEDAKPWPSCLVYSEQEEKCIHIVIAKEEDVQIYIITVYEPNLEKFECDLMTRRKD